MPEMNGRELAKALHSILPDLKVLLMSGYTEDAIKRQGILEEEAAFLSKPVSLDKILLKVSELLQ
jgi:two-component system cell cycle sensor histidine kinase/response regulator CckA